MVWARALANPQLCKSGDKDSMDNVSDAATKGGFNTQVRRLTLDVIDDDNQEYNVKTIYCSISCCGYNVTSDD